jgi:hypothetical protein
MKIQNLKYLNELPKMLPNIIKPTKLNPVGRWNNDCHLKTNKKIDFSNEDHCGPCGQNLLNLNKDINVKNIKNIKINEIEIFKD